MASNISECFINLNVFLSLWVYAWISLLMQDDSFRSYQCRYVIIRILVFVQNWTKFLMCVSSMIVSFLLMSLAPLQTNTVSSLLRLLISLSANGVMVSFLASRHYVLVTSYEFSIKFAVAEVQPQARLSPITIIFFLFLFSIPGACDFRFLLLFRGWLLLYISFTSDTIQYSIAICYHWNRFTWLRN